MSRLLTVSGIFQLNKKENLIGSRVRLFGRIKAQYPSEDYVVVADVFQSTANESTEIKIDTKLLEAQVFKKNKVYSFTGTISEDFDVLILEAWVCSKSEEFDEKLFSKALVFRNEHLKD